MENKGTPHQVLGIESENQIVLISKRPSYTSVGLSNKKKIVKHPVEKNDRIAEEEEFH